jgi:hypothetical protein
VRKLIEIGVEAQRIVVVPNNITDLSQFELDFKRLGIVAAEMGFRLCDHGVPSSKIYDMTRSSEESLFDIANDETDYRDKMRRQRPSTRRRRTSPSPRRARHGARCVRASALGVSTRRVMGQVSEG